MKIQYEWLKIVSILSGLLLVLQLAHSFILRLIITGMVGKQFDIKNASSAASIGIIGGSDGPTAIYVAAGTSAFRHCFTALCVVGVVVPVFIIWRNRKKNIVE